MMWKSRLQTPYRTLFPMFFVLVIRVFFTAM